MKKIRYIPVKPIKSRKLRVAAYCRVSTSGPVQMGSLEIQIKTYTQMIESCSDWIFVGVFYDACSDSTTINEEWFKEKLAHTVCAGLYGENNINEKFEQISVHHKQVLVNKKWGRIKN